MSLNSKLYNYTIRYASLVYIHIVIYLTNDPVFYCFLQTTFGHVRDDFLFSIALD